MKFSIRADRLYVFVLGSLNVSGRGFGATKWWKNNSGFYQK